MAGVAVSDVARARVRSVAGIHVIGAAAFVAVAALGAALAPPAFVGLVDAVLVSLPILKEAVRERRTGPLREAPAP